MIYVLIALFVVFVCVSIGIVFWMQKSTPVVAGDKSQSMDTKNATEFLPIVSFDDNMVEIPNHKYRAILKVDSLNYVFRNNAEQDAVEAEYGGIMNTINLPIQQFRVTRSVDIQTYLDHKKEQFDQTVSRFPEMESYNRSYYNFLQSVNKDQHNHVAQTKENYIVVIYDGASDEAIMDNTSSDERKSIASTELYNETTMLQNGLEKMGLRAKILSTPELIQLFATVLNPDDSQFAKNIMDYDKYGQINSEFRSLFVDGRHVIQPNDYNRTIEEALEGAKNLIELKVVKSEQQPSEATINNASQIEQGLDLLQEQLKRVENNK